MITLLLPSQAEGQIAAGAGRLDAWKRTNPFECPVHVRPERGVIRIARVERAHASGQHALRDEPGIDAKQPLEAREQQPGAHQQHERQRNLRHHEPAPDESRAAPHRAAPAFLAEHVAQAGARELHRRCGADNQSEQHRQADREREDWCCPCESRAHVANRSTAATRARRDSSSRRAGPALRRSPSAASPRSRVGRRSARARRQSRFASPAPSSGRCRAPVKDWRC